MSDYQTRRVKRMERIDALPPDIRALIHEYGFTVVDNISDG